MTPLKIILATFCVCLALSLVGAVLGMNVGVVELVFLPALIALAAVIVYAIYGLARGVIDGYSSAG